MGFACLAVARTRFEISQHAITAESMIQAITGFHLDEHSDWVAELACGHNQHVRHHPPFANRPWVVTPEGRAKMFGQTLICKKCDERAPSDR